MNENIEFINEKLWAVSFSLLPFFNEIGYKPDEMIPAYTESCRISDTGEMILNKDHAGYEILKIFF